MRRRGQHKWARIDAEIRGVAYGYRFGGGATEAFGITKATRVSQVCAATRDYFDADELLPPASLTRDEAEELARMEVEL